MKTKLSFLDLILKFLRRFKTCWRVRIKIDSYNRIIQVEWDKDKVVWICKRYRQWYSQSSFEKSCRFIKTLKMFWPT